jgi:hypothetical protein
MALRLGGSFCQMEQSLALWEKTGEPSSKLIESFSRSLKEGLKNE